MLPMIDTRALLAGSGAALFLGVVMTFGDYVWATWHVRHKVIYGLVHGALMCLCIGAVIGARTRRPGAGGLAGLPIGVAAAAAFYLLAPMLRMAAMLPAWMLFWILFALLQQRLGRAESVMRAVARGGVAALLSGAAFYAISGIWTRPAPGGPNYLLHFVSWSFAFLPGFLALFWIAPLGKDTTRGAGVSERDGTFGGRPPGGR
jgi:hypothetical protein